MTKLALEKTSGRTDSPPSGHKTTFTKDAFVTVEC